MSTVIVNEMALVRHLASSGNQMADALVKVYDALRAEGKEVFIVDAASTANLALSGTSSVDGVTIAAGSLVLAKDQTAASACGIYVVHAGAWTRLKNFNDDDILRKGMAVFVNAGTANSGTVWYCTTFTAIGATVAFTQFSSTTLGGSSVGSTQLATASVTAPKLAVAVAAAVPGTSTITLAGVSGGHIDCTIQLKDINSVNLAAKAMVKVWVSDVAAGAPTSHTPTTTLTTGAIVVSDVANKVLTVVSDATGVVVVRVADTGQTYKLNLALGNSIITSADIVLP